MLVHLSELLKGGGVETLNDQTFVLYGWPLARLYVYNSEP